MLLLNSRNRVVGLLRDGRAVRAFSAADGFHAPGLRFPLLLGLVSYSLSFAVFNLAFAIFKMAFADLFLARASFRSSRGRFYLPRRSFEIVT
jgi:hypothetical protein